MDMDDLPPDCCSLAAAEVYRMQRSAQRLSLVVALLVLARADAQNTTFDCPTSSCWCRDTYAAAEVGLHQDIYYRTAVNHLTGENQTLFLDEWVAPSKTKRPGALIIHGGGYSSGPYNGCSHAKNMSSFAAVAVALARRGFAVLSIDYRCEGGLRKGGDYFHPWYDAVEDARAAVRYMVANAERLQLDTGRIMAFGGSAGAVTVAQLLHALPDSAPMPPPNDCAAALKASCPLPFPGGYEPCLACTRQHDARPVCHPLDRAHYCNSTATEAVVPNGAAAAVRSSSDGLAGGNVTCGIALSGAIVPSSIAAGQVTASAGSSPYLDFHGTAVRYHISMECVLCEEVFTSGVRVAHLAA